MFETSFEDGEAQQIKVSTLSERGAENIGVMELAARVRGGLSSSVQLQSLAGTADHNMNEVKSNLFDGSLRAKYLANVRATQSQPVEATFSRIEPAVVKEYVLACVHDEPSRASKA